MGEKANERILSIENLTKDYGSFRALDSVNLSLYKGVYGILGPNGAGKSTLMKILTLIMPPTAGRVLYRGEEISGEKKDFLNHIGYVPQQQPIYSGFTAEEFMHYIAALKGLDRRQARIQTKQLLQFVHLQDDSLKKTGHFSGGMKQRLLLAQSLLGNPEIILLDEPTAGVDPMERVFIRRIMQKMGQQKTVVITSHIISDIERIAGWIVMLDKGNVRYSGRRKKLLELYETDSLEQVYMEIFG